MACVGCHVIDGVEGMVDRVGPDLTHVGSRRHLAGAVFENTPENRARWIDRPAELKPGADPLFASTFHAVTALHGLHVLGGLPCCQS